VEGVGGGGKYDLSCPVGAEAVGPICAGLKNQWFDGLGGFVSGDSRGGCNFEDAYECLHELLNLDQCFLLLCLGSHSGNTVGVQWLLGRKSRRNMQ